MALSASVRTHHGPFGNLFHPNGPWFTVPLTVSAFPAGRWGR